MKQATQVRRFFFLACLFSVHGQLASVGSAWAQSASIDKSAYSIFNPVPDNALRSFSPDRPSKATGPYTVDAGHFQYETDFSNYTYQNTDGSRTRTFVGPNPTLKVGVTNNIDLEANIAPFVLMETKDLPTDVSNRVTGPSDLFLRAKINLWGNDGGKSAFALIPYVKAPAAPNGIGNGATEGGIIAPLICSLSNDVTLTYNSEIDVLKDGTGDGYHAGIVNILNLSRPIVKDVTLSGELWSSINLDPLRTIHQYSFDPAIAWLARPNLQFDAGANIGLNSETPALQIYAGVAQRF